LTNYNKVDVLKKLDNPDDDIEMEGLLSRNSEKDDHSDGDGAVTPRSRSGDLKAVVDNAAPSAKVDGLNITEEKQHFTKNGVFCLLRVALATAFCALESVHGLPVYVVTLLLHCCYTVVTLL
jgi:hypothetical protein